MPINYVIGDATQPQGDGDKMIVHCCNDMGRWGSGFVVALSKRWEKPERLYRQYHQRHGLTLGQVIWAAVSSEPMIWVANLVGQHGTISETNPHPVKYDAIYEGLCIVASNAAETGASIHMPRMGSGLAGGSWTVIEALVSEICGDLPVTVYDLS